MARAKKTCKKSSDSPKKVTAVSKARLLQSASEGTGKRNRFAIPSAAFGRVARAIVKTHGKDMAVGSISPDAIEALQRFVEARMVDYLDKARLIMGGEKKTLTMKHLKIARIAFSDFRMEPMS